MFIDFFYILKDSGIPVSPASFLTLHKALALNLINNLDDFYTASRGVLIKSERYFDIFDQVFAHYFEGANLPDFKGFEINEAMRILLEDWLNKNPKELAAALGIKESELKKFTPEQLIEYFKKRLEEQEGEHHGGSKWIGTGGTSPVGNAGYHPGGMRVGGVSRNKSAIKVAMERRYKDYSKQGPLTNAMIGEALKYLRNMIPTGPKDTVDIDKTVYTTMKNAGEIEIIFKQSLKDRLKVILAIDNGGWSMDTYIPVVQTLFNYAKSQFADIKTFFFHNTIYDQVWEDPARYAKPFKTDNFIKLDPETRLIIVGDASMANYELMATDGSIYIDMRSRKPSIERLKFLSETFAHSVWLNPLPKKSWGYTHTISAIGGIFKMFELSLEGLEKAVAYLMGK
ncbi:MAG: hypothetical protein JRJ44_05125 [Deltaproteobacteria bacterium]|nr:hypothetical protein [Deltaproteobacteria bacterium]